MIEHIAALGLGSNLGDREDYLGRAIDALGGIGRIVGRSSVYLTEPVGYTDQPEFLNQVVILRTDRAPFELLRECNRIERALGRARLIAMGPRTIDIDMLFYDQETLSEQWENIELILPHPRLHLRRFVLEPLAELMPDYLHPRLGKTVSKLLAELVDPSQVSLWKRPAAAPTGGA